jgi:hypothetical protein
MFLRDLRKDPTYGYELAVTQQQIYLYSYLHAVLC